GELRRLHADKPGQKMRDRSAVIRDLLHWVLFAILLTGLLQGGLVGGLDAAANELQPKRLAIIVKNDAASSSPHAYRAGQGSRAVAARLRDLGYAFLQLQDGGKCAANDRQIVELEVGQAETALACIETVTRNAEIVVLHYSGPIATIGNANYLLSPASEPAPAAKEPRLAVADLLQSAAAKSSFVSVVIVDALEPPSTEPEVRAQHKFAR